MTINTKKQNIFIALAFVFLLTLPFIDNIFDISPVKNLFEKRVAATLPENPDDFFKIKKYPSSFEKFFNDNYGFRKSLITANSWVMDNVFNESPSDRALVGLDGWLYFDNNNSLLDAQGLAKIDDKLIEKGVDAFIGNFQKMRQIGVKYLLVIAADKTTIYPEFLPKYISLSDKNHRIDRFLVALKKKAPNFPVIDLRAVLLEAKKNEVIYHKTDTHWNRRGAHYGYVEIMKALDLDYNSRAKFEEISDNYYRGDISDIMNISDTNIDYDLIPKFERKFKQLNLSDEIRRKHHKPEFFVNKDEKLPVLFSYHDSFFDNLLYFVTQNFSKSYFINEFPCNLDENVIKSYKPDIVIQQFWEGRIEEVLKKCQ